MTLIDWSDYGWIHDDFLTNYIKPRRLRLSLKDIYYVMHKRFDEPTARKAVEWLTKLLVIGPIGAEECLDALGSDEPDFEDSLVRSCAELNDVDFIISRDRDAFAGSIVRCVTPWEHLTKLVKQDEERLGFVWR